MIVTLAETKNFLKIDDDNNDVELQMLIDAGELFLNNMTGFEFDSTNPLAKTCVLFIISDFYNKRGFAGSGGYKTENVSDKTRNIVNLILSQLSMYAVEEIVEDV